MSHLFFKERVCADCRIIEANGCIFDTSYVHSGTNPIYSDPNHSAESSYLHSPKMAFLGYLCISGTKMFTQYYRPNIAAFYNKHIYAHHFHIIKTHFDQGIAIV